MQNNVIVLTDAGPEHYGKYVITDDASDTPNKIISSHRNPQKALKKATSLGATDPVVTYIPEPNVIYIYDVAA